VFPVRQDTLQRFEDRWTEAGNYLGNGPYLMTEWVHQDHITLEANPNYWGPGARVGKITFKMIGDPNAALAAYRNDELELTQVPPGVEKAILGDPTLGKEVLRFTRLSTYGLFFNTTVKPFDQVKVRQAIATAIDRDGWIEKVKNGLGKGATSWLPPGMPGYDARVGREYEFNPERARGLLAEAGYPGGQGFPRVTYTVFNVQDNPLIAQFIQGQMKEHLGIEVDLEMLDPPSFFGKVLGGRDYQMAGLAWVADYPDPEGFLEPLFVSGAGNNIMGYSNKEFDGLAEEARKELDDRERVRLWERAHGIIVKDVPVGFFFHEEGMYLKKGKVGGVVVTGVDGAIPGDTRLAEVFFTP